MVHARNLSNLKVPALLQFFESGLRETWVAHALVESAEKFGDILQARAACLSICGVLAF